MLGLIVNIIYSYADDETKGKDRLWVLLMLSFFGILSFKIKSTLSVDCLDKARDFTRNYKDILMEYFKMM